MKALICWNFWQYPLILYNVYLLNSYQEPGPVSDTENASNEKNSPALKKGDNMKLKSYDTDARD